MDRHVLFRRFRTLDALCYEVAVFEMGRCKERCGKGRHHGAIGRVGGDEEYAHERGDLALGTGEGGAEGEDAWWSTVEVVDVL